MICFSNIFFLVKLYFRSFFFSFLLARSLALLSWSYHLRQEHKSLAQSARSTSLAERAGTDLKYMYRNGLSCSEIRFAVLYLEVLAENGKLLLFKFT